MRLLSAFVAALSMFSMAACGSNPYSAAFGPQSSDANFDAGATTVSRVVLLDSDGGVAEVTGTTIDFGAVRVGGFVERTIEVVNNGPAAVTVMAVPENSLDAAFSFELSSEVLGAGGDAIVTLAYQPTGVGDAAGTINLLVAGGSPSRFAIHLRGRGVLTSPSIQVAPEALEFSKVAVDTYQVRRVTISDSGEDLPDTTDDNLLFVSRAEDGSWTESRAVITGPDAQDFSLEWPPSSYTPQGLASGDSAELRVRFAPGTPGDKHAVLEIHSNVPAQPTLQLAISGTAIPLPPCDLDVRPASINFGSIEPGGTLTLYIGITIRGADPTAECLVNLALEVDHLEGPGTIEVPTIAAPVQLRGTEPLLIPVTLRVSGRGDITGEVDVIAGSQTHRVAINGVGAPPSCLMVAPQQVDFGTVGTGCASHQQFVTLYNTCTSAMTVTALTIDPAASNVFEVASAPALPLTLAGGRSQAIGLTYRAPIQSEQDFASLATTTSDGQAISVSLRGESVPRPLHTDVFATHLSGNSYFLSAVPDMSNGSEPIAITVNGQPWPRIAEDGRVRWRYDAQQNALVFEPTAMPASGATVRVTNLVACE